MIYNNNIICFGFAEWDNPYKTNQHHLMERFSKQNRVLFIESLGLRQPALQKKDLSRIFKRIGKWLGGVRNVSGTLFVFSPLVLPFHKFLLVRIFNHIFLSLQLKYVVAKLKFSDPIIWSYVPNAVEFLGVWNEKLSVYHCVDELSANPRIPGEVVKKMEEEYIRRADITFVTAMSLFVEKKRFSSSVYYMPNVADYDLFSKASDSRTEVNPEISKINMPRLGFIGAVSGYKLDFDLIEYLASRHPEWSIIMIGATGEGEKAADISGIAAKKNIHLMGGKRYEDLPGYIKGFDVCLLPNKINEYTRNMFPMKFFEYLASGKPVVSTKLAALEEFSRLAYFSKDNEEFENNVEKALKENDSALREERIAAAKKFTWETRIEEMSTIINGIK